LTSALDPRLALQLLGRLTIDVAAMLLLTFGMY
jgi:hypothetical protein